MGVVMVWMGDDQWWPSQEEMGIAPLGHRQGLLMAIADLAAYNSQTHGDSLLQHSGLTSARVRGRPQTAPNARGSSPARPRSDGSVSPDRGLKVLPFLFVCVLFWMKTLNIINTGRGNMCDCCCWMQVPTSVQAVCRNLDFVCCSCQMLLPAFHLLHSWCMLHCSCWLQDAAACTARLQACSTFAE